MIGKNTHTKGALKTKEVPLIEKNGLTEEAPLTGKNRQTREAPFMGRNDDLTAGAPGKSTLWRGRGGVTSAKDTVVIPMGIRG